MCYNVCMKNDTTLTIRTTKETKEKAKALFAELGMDVSTGVNIFLKQAVRENRIPFEVAKSNTATEAAEMEFIETEMEALEENK